MKNFEIISRMKKMDKLISHRATGTPIEFAEKIGLSVSRLYGILVEIKELGVPITYSRIQKTYMYRKPGEFTIDIEWKDKINVTF